jgi:hypothetical protein
MVPAAGRGEGMLRLVRGVTIMGAEEGFYIFMGTRLHGGNI